MAMFLKNKEVTADLDTACLHEKGIGQTECCYHIGIMHKIVAQEFISRCIRHASWCNKGNDTTLIELVYAFHDKIAVDGLCSLCVYRVFVVKIIVKDFKVSKRYI